MNKLVELERPAIWKPVRNKDISIRTYAGGYPYMKRGVYGQSHPLTPVVRYAKNFNKGNKNFAIVLFTSETDIKKVEDFMGKQVKNIKQADIQKALHSATMSHMEYLDVYYDKENTDASS